MRRIRPKSLPAHILKKANSYLEERLRNSEPREDLRQFSDTEVHDMIQDILDAGGPRASALEAAIWGAYWCFVRDIRAARKTITLKLVEPRQ